MNHHCRNQPQRSGMMGKISKMVIFRCYLGNSSFPNIVLCNEEYLFKLTDSVFQSVSASYRCTSDGTIEGGGRFWGDGSSACTAWAVNAGPVIRFGGHLSVFASGGLGVQKHYWHDITGSWAEVTDLSHRGLSLEAGAITTWHHIALSVGVSWLHPARQAAATLGLGFAF